MFPRDLAAVGRVLVAAAPGSALNPRSPRFAVRGTLAPMKPDFDLLVIGGGSGGYAAARTAAAAGLRTAIIEGGAQVTMEVTMEREGSAKPVCIAESVSRRYV